MTELKAKLDLLIKAHQGKVAIVVQRFGDDVAYSLNHDEAMPTASLIKFPIMIEAYSQFAEGKAKPGGPRLCIAGERKHSGGQRRADGIDPSAAKADGHLEQALDRRGVVQASRRLNALPQRGRGVAAGLLEPDCLPTVG